MLPNQTKTILVVEDNRVMNAAICDILEIKKYAVLSAADGVEGLALMRQQRPDVVLCDIMMPRMDGYALLQHARADEQLRTVPFIFLTARSAAESRRYAKSIGIDDYLSKPINAEDLYLSLSNILRREEYRQAQTSRQMDQLRAEIVRALQHEFRTPLTFILGYAELLAESPLETMDVETLRASTSAILEGGHRLQNLIEKFLFLANMQHRSELPDTVESTDIISLMAGQAQVHQAAAQAVGLTFTLDSVLDSAIVLAEAGYVREAIERLIENAIQYRRTTSAIIRLSISAADGFLGLHVIDEGIGIPASQLTHLRNPFQQIDRENRTQPGIGLGLAFAQHVARLHGGHLQIESEEGRGSTFTLWLPLPPDTI